MFIPPPPVLDSRLQLCRLNLDCVQLEAAHAAADHCSRLGLHTAVGDSLLIAGPRSCAAYPALRTRRPPLGQAAPHASRALTSAPTLTMMSL